MPTPAVYIFVATYLGVSLGRIPGLRLDRTGIALLGAIGMIVAGTVSFPQAVAAVDVPTLVLLYALMIVSAQLRLGGFYTRTAVRITPLLVHPRLFLFAAMLTSAGLSALLANDIVCLAFTPVLTFSLLAGRRNPVPHLLGLAIASNIGSAATIIGNPQNMLIGQVGRLAFDRFFFWCAPPTAAALFLAYLLLCWIFRKDFQRRVETPDGSPILQKLPRFDRWQTVKGLAVLGVLMVLFLTAIPREMSAIAAAGVLLCSRRMKSREVLQLVDWHLITLFCALFILVFGIEAAGFSPWLLDGLKHFQVDLHELFTLSSVSVVLSNLVSNVPATMLLIKFLDPAQLEAWYALAVSSTFAGNLITIGSIANLIVIEQAAACGVEITFREHARAGIPVTVASLAVLAAWIGL
jgi:Na+/H+ antiporter NhaD/arsenite permease-like protein